MRVSAYSSGIAAAAREAPQRGNIHSVFAAAANIIFPRDLVLSLNAAGSPGMPNGLQLSAPAGAWPFSALHVGMPVLFGAQRLHIEAVNCSLDLSNCPQWDPHIARPEELNLHVVASNMLYLQQNLSSWHAAGDALRTPAQQQRWRDAYTSQETLCTMAHHLCGRGTGLTPAGDDMLAGWMAFNWLLHGPTARLLEACRHILQVARQQTHLLSVCWLSYAAAGDVALPVRDLLEAITRDQKQQVATFARAVLSVGATSGYDWIRGMLLADTSQYGR
jgi:hypothetical protein